MDYPGEGRHHHHHHRDEEGFQGDFNQGGGFQQDGYQQPGVGQGYQQSGMGGQYGGQRREFYIVSEMNNKVVDIEGANSNEGAKLITYDRNQNQQRNQIWYTDSNGYIRSALNDMAFSNSQSGHHLKTTFSGMGDPRAQWTVQGNQIINQAGEVLDIAGKTNRDGAEIISYQDDGGSNQRWRIEYIN